MNPSDLTAIDRLHGLRAQAVELRRSQRSEAHDAADSLEREADDMAESLFDAMAQRVAG